MRLMMFVLAATSLSACDRNSNAADGPGVAITPASISYDGADYRDTAAKVTHGERLSLLLGCKGCHGEDLRGRNVTAEDKAMGDWWAPNVTLAVAGYDDAALDKLIRHGQPKDGRAFYFMPAESLQYVSDADYGALVAYLRTLQAGGERMPPVKKGPLFIELEKKGEFAPSTEMIRRFRAQEPEDLGDRHKLGRYIAMTVCSECHNGKLQGYEGFSPSLDIVGTYNDAELARLLTTGEGKVKKDLGLMSITGKHRFSKFTDHERTAVVRYLKARADQQKPAQAQ